jgi:hypothetical protein
VRQQKKSKNPSCGSTTLLAAAIVASNNDRTPTTFVRQIKYVCDQDQALFPKMHISHSFLPCSGYEWQVPFSEDAPFPFLPLYPIRSGRTGSRRHQPRQASPPYTVPFPGKFQEKAPPRRAGWPFLTSRPRSWASERARERERESNAMPRDLCRRGPCGLKKKKLGLATCLYCFLRVHTSVRCAVQGGSVRVGRFGCAVPGEPARMDRVSWFG